MIGIILGILGLAGGGGIAALVAKFGLKVVLGTGRSYARKVPPKVWIALAIAAALLVGYLVHQHRAHNALKAAHDAGYTQAKAEDVEAARKIAARARQIEANGRVITQKVEVQHAKDNARVNDNARDLRLRAPPGIGGVRVTGSALPGLSGPTGSGDGAAQGAISGLAQIPWLPLIDHGELCDLDRAKLTALQSWVALQRKAQDEGKRP